MTVHPLGGPKFAAQATGKAHRIRTPDDAVTLCGLAVDHATWSTFPEDEATDESRCRRCWYHPPYVTVETTVELLIVEYVNRAAQSYAWRAPGHGRFLLERLRLKLERLEATVAEARDVLTEP